MRKFPSVLLAAGLCLGGFLSACSSTRPVKSQAYARLSGEKTFEYDFSTVWKGVEAAARGWKITDRDPEEVKPSEENQITERKLETDWIYTRSNDKYVEYQVNGSPRKQYLQLRVRYRVLAKRQIGGVHVTVRTEEEVENLKADGTPAGYSGTNQTDSGRARELLERIEQSIRQIPAT